MEKIFKLDEDELEKIHIWKKNHTCSYNNDMPTLGEKLTYKFTPTGLGNIIEVKCICGESLDLTEYER